MESETQTMNVLIRCIPLFHKLTQYLYHGLLTLIVWVILFKSFHFVQTAQYNIKEANLNVELFYMFRCISETFNIFTEEIPTGTGELCSRNWQCMGRLNSSKALKSGAAEVLKYILGGTTD